MKKFLLKSGIAAFVTMLYVAAAFAQAKPPTPREIFRDSDGNLVSNNEFVDIRVANFNYPDATIIKMLPDGTKEFRLQKIPQEGMAAPEIQSRRRKRAWQFTKCSFISTA